MSFQLFSVNKTYLPPPPHVYHHDGQGASPLTIAHGLIYHYSIVHWVTMDCCVKFHSVGCWVGSVSMFHCCCSCCRMSFTWTYLFFLFFFQFISDQPATLDNSSCFNVSMFYLVDCCHVETFVPHPFCSQQNCEFSVMNLCLLIFCYSIESSNCFPLVFYDS